MFVERESTAVTAMHHPVHIIQTGLANTASVAAAIVRCGREVVLTSEPDDVLNARAVVLPGVGSFGAGMSMMSEKSLVEPIRRRIVADRATLCICLGMQLLFESSEESPGVEGLSIIRGHVSKFESSERIRVPQLGWNLVKPEHDFRAFTEGYAYFANSYRYMDLPADDRWMRALTDHGGVFISALQRGAVLACQFHPELSGRWGHQLIANWLTSSK